MTFSVCFRSTPIYSPNTCGAGAPLGELTPVPVNEMWSGDDAAFVVRLKVAVREPAAVGVNTKE